MPIGGIAASIFMVGFFLWNARNLYFSLKDGDKGWTIIWGIDAIFAGVIAAGVISIVISGNWGDTSCLVP